jgi:hypothetical protein
MPNFEEDLEKTAIKISVFVVEPMKEPYTKEMTTACVFAKCCWRYDIEAVYHMRIRSPLSATRKESSTACSSIVHCWMRTVMFTTSLPVHFL